MAGRPAYEGFEGFNPNDQGQVNVGRGTLQQLLDSGIMTNETRQRFFNQILGGGGPPAPGGGGGGGRHGGGGGGGGGGCRGGGSGGPLDQSSFIPDQVNDAMIDRILQMLEDPGLPQDVYDDQLRGIREQGAVRERERLLRRGAEFAGRGLFGGGVANRDLERIEAEESGQRRQQQDQLNMLDAQTAMQAIQQAFGGSLGIGQLNLGERELEVNAALQRAAIAAQRAAARGQLGLGYAQLNQSGEQFAAQQALQQYLLNLQYGGFGNTPGVGGGDSGPRYDFLLPTLPSLGGGARPL
jgi:hypothetical protein